MWKIIIHMIQVTISFAHRHSHVNWALADQMLVSGSNFVTSILLARVLGIAEFGRFTLAWMVILFVQSIQQAVINAPMMTIGPKQEPDERPAYFGSVFVQQIVFAVLSAALTYSGVLISSAFFPDWGTAQLALPLTAAVFLSQIQDFLRRCFFTLERPAISFVCDFIRYLGQIGLLFWLFFSMPELLTSTMALWVMVGTSILAILAASLKLPSLSWSAHSWRAVLSRHWHFSKWLSASAVMQWTTGNLFVLVAGVMLGSVAVGALKAAQNILGIAHILFQGLENSSPLHASQSFTARGNRGLSKYLKKLSLTGGAITAVICLIAFLIPDFLLHSLYGDEYAQYGNVLRIYAALYFIIFFTLPLRIGLRTMENTKSIFIAYVIMTIVTLLIARLIIITIGILGAVLGMLIVQIIYVSIMYYYLSMNLSMNERDV